MVCPLSNPSICTLDPVSCLLEGIAPARFSFHTDSIKLSFFFPLNHPYKNTKQALKTKLFTLFVSSYNSFIVIPFAIRKFLELSILWLQSLSNSFFILIFPLCTLHTFCNCLTAKSRTWLSDFTFTHWRRKWQPTPVFLPGESQGQGSLVGCRLWGPTESDSTEVTQQQQQHSS